MFRRCLLAASLLTVACGQAAPSEATEYDQVFQRQSGYGWSGGDAANSIPLPGSRSLWTFGDSTLGQVANGRRDSSIEMRWGNTVAIQSGVAPGAVPRVEAFLFDWGPPDSNGWLPLDPALLDDPSAPPSAAVARSLDLTLLTWPLHGVTVGTDLVLFDMPVTPFACDTCSFPFKVHGSTAAIVHGVDRPYDQWGVRPGAGWDPASAPQPVYVPHSRAARALEDPTGVVWGTSVLPASDGTTLYVYGSRTDAGATSFVVARLEGVERAADVEDFSRWRFWDGAAWITDADAAAPISAPAQLEGSVSEIPEEHGGGFVLVRSGDVFEGRIRIAVAASPRGPFEERYELDLADCPVAGFDPAAQLMTYAAKAHPELGDTESLLVSFVTTPVGEAVVIDQHFYTPRFMRLPWSEILDNDRSSPDRCGATTR